SSGTPDQAFLESWGDSPLLNGWHDPGDAVLAGDFMDLGHDQLLMINNDTTPPNIGRSTVIDLSSGTPQQVMLATWDGSSEIDGWSLANVALVGKFANGGDKIAFLPA